MFPPQSKEKKEIRCPISQSLEVDKWAQEAETRNWETIINYGDESHLRTHSGGLLCSMDQLEISQITQIYQCIPCVWPTHHWITTIRHSSPVPL